MPAQRKYDQETRDRAVRMVEDRRRDYPDESALRSLQRVSEVLGVPYGTLKGWIERKEIDSGERPGVPSAVEARIKVLERENAELRRANEILKTASALMDAWRSNAVLDLWRQNRCLYGADKLAAVMRKAGHNVGRDQVARLMKIVGACGNIRGKHRTWTTKADSGGVRHPDLINRAWNAPVARISGG